VEGQSDTECCLAVKQVLREDQVDEARLGRHRVFISYSVWHDSSPRNGKATEVAAKREAQQPLDRFALNFSACERQFNSHRGATKATR